MSALCVPKTEISSAHRMALTPLRICYLAGEDLNVGCFSRVALNSE